MSDSNQDDKLLAKHSEKADRKPKPMESEPVTLEQLRYESTQNKKDVMTEGRDLHNKQINEMNTDEWNLGSKQMKKKNADHRNKGNEKAAVNQSTGTNAASKEAPKKRFPRWLRITLRIMRFFLVPVLCLAALYTGLVIGYGKLGGQDPSDVLKLETWKHLYDLVFAK